MKITHKTKFKELSRIEPILSVSDIDLIETISKYEIPLKIGKIAVKNANDVSFEDIVLFWDAESELDIIKATAKAFLGIESEKEVYDLPLIDFMRLIILGKDTAKQCADSLAYCKRELSSQEIAAGFDELTGNDFDLIAYFIKISGLSFNSPMDAYKLAWTIIIYTIKQQFERDLRQERLTEIYKSEYDSK